ncbi:MAG TPA: outer membrane protein transport protein [Nitrospira sp.]|nr:outer membrane protein transport protein [Nitrospira sp.]
MECLKRVLQFSIYFGLSALIFPFFVFSQALRFQPQSADAAGQGNAFVAQSDSAAAIHFNPAGLTQVGDIQALFGTALMGGAIQAHNPPGINTRGDFGGSVVFPPPSHTYFSANLRTFGWKSLADVTVGLGLTSPYGLSTRFPDDGPFNTATTSAALPLLDIKPTVAYRVNNNLSVGVSADIYTFASFLGEGHAEQRLISGSMSGIPAGASLEVNGKGTTAGVTVSLLYTPLRNADGNPFASIGVVYRSQAVLPLSGSLLVDGQKVADASTTLVLPTIYTGGIAIWPIRTREREWKLECDVDWVGWQSMKNLDVRLSTGTTVPQPQQWKSVPVVAVGTEYKWLNPDWLPQWDVALRSGYTHTPNPVPDSTFNPGILSLSSNTISVGVGLLCKQGGRFMGFVPCGGNSPLWPKAIGIDVAYQEWIYDRHIVIGNVNPSVNGSYDAYVHLGIVSLKFVL